MRQASMKKNKPTSDRNPVVVYVAIIMLIMDIALVALGIIYFTNLGWMVAGSMIIGGVGSGYLAVMSIVTGKPEWILLDLILPG